MNTFYDWTVFTIMALISFYLLIQAYINLVEKRFTRFGIDSIMVSINLKLAGKVRRKFVESHMEDPQRIRQMGTAALLFALGFVLGLLRYWFSIIQPLTR